MRRGRGLQESHDTGSILKSEEGGSNHERNILVDYCRADRRMAGGKSDEGRRIRGDRRHHSGDPGRNSWRVVVRDAGNIHRWRIDWIDHRGVCGSGDPGVDHAVAEEGVVSNAGLKKRVAGCGNFSAGNAFFMAALVINSGRPPDLRGQRFRG